VTVLAPRWRKSQSLLSEGRANDIPQADRRQLQIVFSSQRKIAFPVAMMAGVSSSSRMNGAGKTAIMEAINFCLYGRSRMKFFVTSTAVKKPGERQRLL